MSLHEEPYEQTPLWLALGDAFAGLEAANALEVRVPRAVVLQRLCAALVRARVTTEAAVRSLVESQAALAKFLERLAREEADQVEMYDLLATRYPHTELEDVRQRAMLVLFQVARERLAPEEAATQFRMLAARVRSGAV